MTDPTRRPEHAAYREQEPAPDPEVLQLAAKIFNLARQGGTDVLATYVDAGVPANLCNDKGDTLVMLAAYHGHPQTVAALLEHGADPDRTNDRGQSPLAGAIFKGEADVVAVLLTAGADPDLGTPSARATSAATGSGSQPRICWTACKAGRSAGRPCGASSARIERKEMSSLSVVI